MDSRKMGFRAQLVDSSRAVSASALGRPASPPEIVLAAGLDYRHIGVHHHVLDAGELFDPRAAGVVIPVRVADEEDLYVAELEAELLDAGANERDVGFEVAVDEDRSDRRGPGSFEAESQRRRQRWAVLADGVPTFLPGFRVAIERAHERVITRIIKVEDRLRGRTRRLNRRRIDYVTVADDSEIVANDSTKSIADDGGRRVRVFGPAEYAAVGLMGPDPLGTVGAERDGAAVRQLRKAFASVVDVSHAHGAIGAIAAGQFEVTAIAARREYAVVAPDLVRPWPPPI